MARPGLLLLLALFCLLAAASVEAFLGPTPCPQQPLQQRRVWQQQPQQLQKLRRREALPLVSRPEQRPASLVTHGRPLYGIFGLGTPELVIIALVAGIVLGPDKIVDLARGVGKAAGELKSVPQEFEKGLKSGEEAAVKAKEELAKKKGEKEE